MTWPDGHIPIVIVKGSVSKQGPVMGGVPQGSVWELALFNIFVGDMNNVIECTPSKLLVKPSCVE